LEEPQLNEDYYWPNRLFSKGPFLLSDGASESYDARKWAHLLVTNYLEKPEFDAAWVDDVTNKYALTYQHVQLSWSQQAAFDRGSFATLLVLNLDELSSQVHLLAVGDSIAVLGDSERICSSFPYTSADEFELHPLLISTRPERNVALFKQDPKPTQMSWSLVGLTRPCILAMTDALGAWLLSNPDHRYGVLVRIKSNNEFIELIEAERAAGNIRRDDTTLLVIK
jgi:hypothetical protein